MEYSEIIANPGLQLLGVVVATLVLSYAANYWLSRIFVGKTYRYLIAPGVVVHEYSHALGCLLTGARIREIRLFDARGGRVVHDEPRLPLAEGIISMAPILGAATVVYVLARLLVPSFVGFGELEFSSWQFLVFGYLAATVTAAMAPSKQDLKVGLAGFSMLCLLITIGSFIEPVAVYFEAVLGGLFDALLSVLTFGLVVLAVLTFASGVTYVMLHRTVRKDARYEPLD